MDEKKVGEFNKDLLFKDVFHSLYNEINSVLANVLGYTRLGSVLLLPIIVWLCCSKNLYSCLDLAVYLSLLHIFVCFIKRIR